MLRTWWCRITGPILPHLYRTVSPRTPTVRLVAARAHRLAPSERPTPSAQARVARALCDAAVTPSSFAGPQPVSIVPCYPGRYPEG